MEDSTKQNTRSKEEMVKLVACRLKGHTIRNRLGWVNGKQVLGVVCITCSGWNPFISREERKRQIMKCIRQ